MSGKEDLQRLVNEIESVHKALRETAPALEEMIASAGTAMELYRRFEKAYSVGTFDVRALVSGTDGRMEDRPFDWVSLDSSER